VPKINLGSSVDNSNAVVWRQAEGLRIGKTYGLLLLHENLCWHPRRIGLHTRPQRNQCREIREQRHSPKPERRGAFDIAACVRAYLKYFRFATRGTLAEERTRLTKAKADREELNLLVRSVGLIEVITVEKSVFEKGGR
jgi:hypothetical protein